MKPTVYQHQKSSKIFWGKAFFILTFFFSAIAFSQPIEGDWYHENDSFIVEDDMGFNYDPTEEVPYVKGTFGMENFQGEERFYFYTSVCGSKKVKLFYSLTDGLFMIDETIEEDNTTCNDFNDQFQEMYFEAFSSGTEINYEIQEIGNGVQRLIMFGNGPTTYFQISFTSAPMSTQDSDKLEIKTYPNPAADWLYFSQPLSEIYIYDTSGRHIQTHPSATQKLNISQLQKGTYIIQANTQSGIPFSQKLIKN